MYDLIEVDASGWPLEGEDALYDLADFANEARRRGNDEAADAAWDVYQQICEELLW